jgi:hypothetical protein
MNFIGATPQPLPLVSGEIISGGGSTAFDPATIFGVSDVGGYWTTASLSDMKQSQAGTTAVTAADGTQPVGYVAEKSGKGSALQTKHDFGGRDPGDGTKRPILYASGGINYLNFDGVDDFLADTNYNDNLEGTRYTLNGTTGWTRMSVVRLITGTDNSGNPVFAPSGANFGDGFLKVSNTVGANGKLFMQAGTVGSNSGSSITGSGSTFFVVTEQFNGASSSLQIDGGAPVVSNVGTNNSGGLFIGCEIFGGYQRLDWVETLQIGRLLDVTTELNPLRTLFGSHIGKTI